MWVDFGVFLLNPLDYIHTNGRYLYLERDKITMTKD